MSNYNKNKYIAKKWEHDRGKFDSNISCYSRAYMIAEEIAKGATYRELAGKFSAEWNVSPQYIKSIVTEAIQLFQDDEIYKNIKQINNDRLNDIYKEARQAGDLKSAIKAVDTLNKANGVYDNMKAQVNINADDNNITITFGGEPLAPKAEEVSYSEVDSLIDSVMNKKEDE